MPVATLAINTTYHKSLGHTPYELTFGRRPSFQGIGYKENQTPQDLYARLISDYIKSCSEDVVAIQAASQEQARKFFEKSHSPRVFDLGKKVLVKARSRKSKLAPKYEGPFVITNREKAIYKLKNAQTSKSTTRHSSALKPFLTNEDDNERSDSDCNSNTDATKNN